MNSGMSKFMDLPTPIKVGVLVASGAGLGVVVAYLPPGVTWIVLIGLAVVFLLLLLYWRLLKWLKARKAAPMERDLMKNTSATPQAAGSDPAAVARLDDLRKRFESGIEKFRAAGKSLYDFPWYMVVGEPGSGKTEAVRHSNVGFPSGLQDMLQGAGGTLNMNWWFTDHAVILDTAGRLMFEQADVGGGREWKEFLNLLKKYRRRCPINGVLLVIPADSLIRDTADEIEQKASKIARQFDVIQRALDVRFPVFVVITKSDLINGFRDFFDNLTDPELQHQILGWSNPLPLDEPYRLDFIKQHLKTIRGCLLRRRLALMQQIVCGETGVEEKRSVETLYAFPQSLASIAPRLARYLELIFSVGSKWSCKPLFFRGIYFTSSMREGSALDAELAEALGVSVDALPEGRVWERDRAYFLRDLLLKKIFPEQGLVTSATDAKKQHVRRKAAVLVSAAASIILLLVCTVFAKYSYSRRIGDLQSYLQRCAKWLEDPDEHNELRTIIPDQDKYRLVCKELVFTEQEKPKEEGKLGQEEKMDRARSNWPVKVAHAVGNYKPTWLFLPADKAQKITAENLREAAKIIYEATVLEPFLEAACDVMATQEGGKWAIRDDSHELRALRQLIWIRSNRPLSEDGEGSYSRSDFLDDLAKYVIQYGLMSEDRREDETKLYYAHKSALHEPLGLYDKNDKNWSRGIILRGDPKLEEAITNGIDLFNQSWQLPNNPNIRAIEQITPLLEKFDSTEQDLKGVRGSLCNEPNVAYVDSKWSAYIKSWETSFRQLKQAVDDINSCASTDILKDSSSLVKLREAAEESVKRERRESRDLLLRDLDLSDPNLSDIRGKLDIAEGSPTNELDMDQQLKGFDEKFFCVAQGGKRMYEVRFEMYQIENAELEKTQQVTSESIRLNQVYQKIEEVTDDVSKARGWIQEPTHILAAEEPNCVLNWAEKRRLYCIVRGSLDQAEETQISELVRQEAENVTWDWTRVPKDTRQEEYNPAAAAVVLGNWKSLRDTIEDFPIQSLKKAYERRDKMYVQYSTDYCNYWLETVPKNWIDTEIPHKDNWADQSRQLTGLDFSDVLANLRKFGNDIRIALDKLEGHILENDEKKKFDDNMKSLYEGVYKERWEKILRSWADLSNDVLDARKTLLEKKAHSVTSEYFPSPNTYRPQSWSEFVYTYWTELTLASLRRLVEDTIRTVEGEIEDFFEGYGKKFPLHWDGTEDLGLDELREAHLLLERLPSQEKYPSGTIGHSDKTGVSELVDALFAQLRDASVVKNGAEVKRIGKVLDGLPSSTSPYYCKISFVWPVPKDIVTKEFTRWFQIVQKEAELPCNRRTTDPASSTDSEVCTVEYGTNKTIYINFYAFETDPKVVRLGQFEGQLGPFKGSWAILRMLHQYRSRSKSKGQIHIRLPFTDKAKGKPVEREVCLKLEFFKDEDCTEKIDSSFVEEMMPARD